MGRISRYRMLARKALTRPPSAVARRAWRELAVQLSRPWVRIRPGVLSDRAICAAIGCESVDALPSALAEAPFFPMSGGSLENLVPAFRARYPDAQPAIEASAARVLAHEFDLLGSGPCRLGTPLPWRRDFKTGAEWPRRFAFDLDYEHLTPESDVKVPWELSRFQHAATLGQAWLLTARDPYRDEFVDEVGGWLRDNPYGYSVNWICAMDVAIRAHNLQWGYHYLFGGRARASAAFALEFARTLYLHGEFVEQHLETSDVNGNHYLADAVGLVSIGLWFRQARDGDRWFRLGARMIEEEIVSQVHPDGVDFEQSTAYHRLVTEMFATGLLLMRRGGLEPSAAAWDRLARMTDYVAAYTKPNGLAPLVGDADDGRMHKLAGRDVNDHRYLASLGAALFAKPAQAAAAGRFHEEAFWMLGPDGAAAFDALPPAPAAASQAFHDGGVYVLRGHQAHAVVDCAEVGMRGRGGHGHNDILSFELVLGGLPLITDCGAFVYTADAAARDRFRSTAYHNTVQVDGEELNRFLSPPDMWRLSDDARPRDVAWQVTPEWTRLSAAHTGYERLADPVRHARTWILTRDGELFVVRDRLHAAGWHHYTWRWHLAPGTDVRLDRDRVYFEPAGQQMTLERRGSHQPPLTLEAGWVSPSYGRRVPLAVVRCDLEATGDVDVTWIFRRSTSEADEARIAALVEQA